MSIEWGLYNKTKSDMVFIPIRFSTSCPARIQNLSLLQGNWKKKSVVKVTTKGANSSITLRKRMASARDIKNISIIKSQH